MDGGTAAIWIAGPDVGYAATGVPLLTGAPYPTGIALLAVETATGLPPGVDAGAIQAGAEVAVLLATLVDEVLQPEAFSKQVAERAAP